MKKCRLSTGMDGSLSAVICAVKRGLNLARFLPSLFPHNTLREEVLLTQYCNTTQRGVNAPKTVQFAAPV